MIYRREQAEVDIREKMRGGDGTVEIIKHIPGDDFGGKCRLCASLVIEPGCGIGYHEHENEQEIYIIQKGTGIVTDNGEDVEVSAGDAVLTGDGAGHSVKNTGSETMEITAVIIT